MTAVPELHRLQQDVSRWENQHRQLQVIVRETLRKLFDEPEMRKRIRELMRQAIEEE